MNGTIHEDMNAAYAVFQDRDDDTTPSNDFAGPQRLLPMPDDDDHPEELPPFYYHYPPATDDEEDSDDDYSTLEEDDAGMPDPSSPSQPYSLVPLVPPGAPMSKRPAMPSRGFLAPRCLFNITTTTTTAAGLVPPMIEEEEADD